MPVNLSIRRSFLSILLTAALALSACARTPLPSAVPSPTAIRPPTTSTASPAPTFTLAPTFTPTPDPRQTGYLTSQQQAVLAKAALAYVSPFPEDAIATARRLNYLGLNVNPTSMCGPLSLAILQDAGLVDPSIPLKEFYLLNPRPDVDERFLQTVFPPDRFIKIEQSTPINQVDYSSEPLFPGDFLYIFANPGGNFDHMVVVSRVDDAGRAYAVSNLITPWGAVIREVMLYDPAQPGSGQFNEWMDRKNKDVGLTGFGGFWLWRLNGPLEQKTDALQQLEIKINTIIEAAGGDWHILIKEVGGEVLFSRLAYNRLHPASTIKLADAVLFMKVVEEKKVEDLAEFLSTHGFDGRTYEQLLQSMVVNSEESATDSIEEYTAQFINPNVTLSDMGFPNTTITPRQSTAVEMSRMIEMLYSGSLLSPGPTTLLMDLLAEYSPSDLKRTGVIREYLAEGDQLYNKRGSLVIENMIVADLALVEVGDKAYTLAFYAYRGSDPPATYEALEAGIEDITHAFWDYLVGD